MHGLDTVQLCHANVSMSVIARMDKLSASDSFRFQHMRKQLAAVLGAANVAGHIQAIAWHHDAQPLQQWPKTIGRDVHVRYEQDATP